MYRFCRKSWIRRQKAVCCEILVGAKSRICIGGLKDGIFKREVRVFRKSSRRIAWDDIKSNHREKGGKETHLDELTCLKWDFSENAAEIFQSGFSADNLQLET